MIWSSRWFKLAILIFLFLMGLSLLLPAIQQAREAARRSQSRNNLKQIGLALHNYHDTHKTLPPGGTFNANGEAFHGWMTAITPYLEASNWYHKVNFTIAWDHPDQIEYFQQAYWPVYTTPRIGNEYAADGLMRVHYAGSSVLFYRNSQTRFSDLNHELSQTVMVGDARGDFEPVGYSYHWRDVESGLNTSDAGFGCSVRDASQMLLADGSVRTFSHAIDSKAFAGLRGTNQRWRDSARDVSVPPLPYHIAAPILLLGTDSWTSSSLMGVEDEKHQLIRAWFVNTAVHSLHRSFPNLNRQMERLRSHQSLRSLNLRDAVSDSGLQVLEELPNLETVTVGGQAITDRGVEILCRCQNLKHLSLKSTAITDQGWEFLATAPRLESLHVELPATPSPGFSPAAVVKFLELKQQCKLHINRGRSLSIETIQKLATQNQRWPDYEYSKAMD